MKHCFAAILLLSFSFTSGAQQTLATPSILNAGELEKVMPPTVFFKGQTAPVQLRNAGGVRFSPSGLLLAALVDTSGYSSNIQARYQAYLITESTVFIDGHSLPAGAYGVGFLPGDSFVVMDIGGHDLFLAHSTPDPNMRRPRPLQITPDPEKSGQLRLYEGRSFVIFRQDVAQL